MNTAQILTQLRNGQTLFDLGEQLAQARKAARLTMRPAVVTLTLTLTPEGDEQLTVKDKITAKLPQHANSTLFFEQADGSLSAFKESTTREIPFGGDGKTRKVTDPDTEKPAKKLAPTGS